MATRLTRRVCGILALSLITVVALSPSTTLAKPKAALCPCDTWSCGGGISGGGTIQTDTGTATFSIFAMQMPPPSDAFEAADVGRVHWTAVNADGTTTTLHSVQVDDYGWTGKKDAGIRWIRGVVLVNGEDQAPFFLRAVDNGSPEAAADTVELAVGAAIEESTAQGFGYHAMGTLASGDFQIINDVPIETMEPTGD